MRFIRKLIGVCAALSLALCGCYRYSPTQYERADTFGYGYRDLQLSDSVFRISFSGNTVTKAEEVERFALYRAAEVTLLHGGTHFQILEDKAANDVYSGSSSSGDNSATVTQNIKPTGSVFPSTTTAEASSSYSNSSWTATAHSIIKTIQIYRNPPSNSRLYQADLIWESMRKDLKVEDADK